MDKISKEETVSEVFKKAFEYLAIYLGVDINDAKDCMILGLAITYANEHTYSIEPKTPKEFGDNEIFIVKAKSYYGRKKLSPFSKENRDKINQIREYEHHQIFRIRQRMPIDYSKEYLQKFQSNNK